MAFEADHIRHLIVRPTIKFLGMHSPDAEEILLGIMAHESLMGKYCRQIKGPAEGFWQVEPETERDNWDTWLHYRPEYQEKMKVLMRLTPEADSLLVSNPYYCVAHARIKLWRCPGALPSANDEQGMAEYWDRFYNANPEKGFPHEWIAHYRKYVKGE